VVVATTSAWEVEEDGRKHSKGENDSNIDDDALSSTALLDCVSFEKADLDGETHGCKNRGSPLNSW
jgi:hypothetical protein